MAAAPPRGPPYIPAPPYVIRYGTGSIEVTPDDAPWRFLEHLWVLNPSDGDAVTVRVGGRPLVRIPVADGDVRCIYDVATQARYRSALEFLRERLAMPTFFASEKYTLRVEGNRSDMSLLSLIHI